MDTITRVNRELAHDAWANRETLRSLLAAEAVPERAREIMAHIIGAGWVWLRRLGQPAPEIPVWPDLRLPECESRLDELSRAWQTLSGSLTPEGLDREVSYTNSKGETWSSTVSDVLTHVVQHGAYHRGQIAMLVGRAGGKAAYTDFIESARRGHLDRG